jgi:hypothetical protein
VSKRERHDSDRRGDRRDGQPEDEQQRRLGESDAQEGDSLTALKAILAKVAAILNPLHLTAEESIRLVEQLYGKVLETDLQLAGETDDTRKSSVLAAIQNATIRREGDKVIVEYAAVEKPAPGKPETEEAKAWAKDEPAQAASADAAPAEGRPAAATKRKPAPAGDAPAEDTPTGEEAAS